MAQIQIWTRDVNGFELYPGNRPQHTFLIKINDDGTMEILRGGPTYDNMIIDDILIVRTEYSKSAIPSDYYDPSSTFNPLHYQGQTIKTASQSEIDSLWDSAWNVAQSVNAQNYDYEAFTQNCNSTTALLAQTMGLKNEVKTFLSQKNVFTPGFDDGFNHSIYDKIYDLITHQSSAFKENINFIKQNPNTEFENGNTNDFNNIVRQALQQKLQQSLIVDQQLTSSYTQFETSVNTKFRPMKDPLIIDGGNDGLELNSWQNSGVLFDLDGDGNAESSGWVKSSASGGDELFLALDKNGNGNIDSVEELFGNDTTGGFAQLSAYDSNHDNII